MGLVDEPDYAANLFRHGCVVGGGRVTEQLRKQKHGVVLHCDVLQIMPQANHRMLSRLRSAVEKIIAVTKEDSKFLATVEEMAQAKEDNTYAITCKPN